MSFFSWKIVLLFFFLNVHDKPHLKIILFLRGNVDKDERKL